MRQQAKGKQGHIEELKAHESHKPGKDEGCVTRCKWELPKGGYRKVHASDEFPGHNHRKNGLEYHMENEKDWYNLDFSIEGPARARFDREVEHDQLKLTQGKPDPRNHRARETWWMKDTGGNFRSMGKPWRFNAHHIIPEASLHNAFFKLQDGVGKLALLQQAKYNLNRGLNIIFLPVTEVYARLYQLPSHLSAASEKSSNHTAYNNLVETQLDTITNTLNKADSQGEDHPALTPANLEGLKTDLENFSLSMREVLRDLGIARAQANQLREPGNFISQSLDIID